MYVNDLDWFVTVQFLEDAPTVLSIGQLCEGQGYSHEWTGGQKLHLEKCGRKIPCNTKNYVTGSSSSTETSVSQDPR